jgi:ABC-type transport system substrate-binding protein
MGIGRNINHERLDDLRRGRGPVQEHIIDEFAAGRLSRRDFIRKGSAIGLSMPLIGGILAACGSSGTTTSGASPSAAGKAGATIKAGILVPAAAINPITIADQGGLELIGNVGEFLVFTDHAGNYHPWLATSWTANSDASVWTFKIRQGVFGKSDWLDGEMSLVDYGARAVPNVYLKAPLQSIDAKTGQGSWNAAHFNNSTYDKLSKQFLAAVDISTQRQIAGQIQRLLLDETPIIFAYWYNYLTATAKNVTGVYPTAQGQLFLWNAAKA